MMAARRGEPPKSGYRGAMNASYAVLLSRSVLEGTSVGMREGSSNRLSWTSAPSSFSACKQSTQNFKLGG